jgi:hypothetical protein
MPEKTRRAIGDEDRRGGRPAAYVAGDNAQIASLFNAAALLTTPLSPIDSVANNSILCLCPNLGEMHSDKIPPGIVVTRG